LQARQHVACRADREAIPLNDMADELRQCALIVSAIHRLRCLLRRDRVDNIQISIEQIGMNVDVERMAQVGWLRRACNNLLVKPINVHRSLVIVLP
jgi:hypothetical protein